VSDAEIQKVFDRWAAREQVVRGTVVFSVPMFTANSVPGSGNRPLKTSHIRDWRRKRLIFGARYKGRDYFPAFQFNNGQPKPIIAEVLRLLQPADNWQTMFWFYGANVWVDEDQQPFTALESNPEAVIEAACHATESISD
jgi:hypothetical protein